MAILGRQGDKYFRQKRCRFARGTLSSDPSVPEYYKLLLQRNGTSSFHSSNIVSRLLERRNAMALSEGKFLHSYIVYEHNSQSFVQSCILEMYANCGAFEEARSVLDQLCCNSTFPWNTMIRSFVRYGKAEEALQLFRQMLLKGVKADKQTFIAVLGACCSPLLLEEGRKINVCIAESGYEDDMIIETALLSMYGRCGSLEAAGKVFDRMAKKDVVTWNAMIAMYALHGFQRELAVLVYKMKLIGIFPDKVTLLNILNALQSPIDLPQGRWIHMEMIDISIVPDDVFGTALINMYGKCGCLEEALNAFEGFAKLNVAPWNALIGIYVQNARGEEAIALFHRMMDSKTVRPDKITWISILNACDGIAALGNAKMMHACIMVDGNGSTIVVENAIVSMYGRCNNVEDAQLVFEKMSRKDAVSWTAMITMHAQEGDYNQAFEIFHKMHAQGVTPDEITFLSILDACCGTAFLAECKRAHAYITQSGFESNAVIATALVNAYGKCGSTDVALRLFRRIGKKNVVSWNAVIASCAQNHNDLGALYLFQWMQSEAISPNNITFVSCLEACASISSIGLSKLMHGSIVRSGLTPNVVIHNTIIHMYGKCGSTEDAREVFSKMEVRDAITWNAMIGVYGQNNNINEALQLLEDMQLEGMPQDKFTYVSIIDGCTNSAAIAKGRRMHVHVVSGGLTSDIVVGNALLNMYSKCGDLQETQIVFDTMLDRNVVSWNAVTLAYGLSGQAEKAIRLFQQMQIENIIPDNFTVLSILFACSHKGLLREGCHCLISICQNYEIAPTSGHYGCLLDLIGRAGAILAGEDLVYSMPFEIVNVSWTTLLGACKLYNDVKQGELAAFGIRS